MAPDPSVHSTSIREIRAQSQCAAMFLYIAAKLIGNFPSNHGLRMAVSSMASIGLPREISTRV
jgi:hypothetical protein